MYPATLDRPTLALIGIRLSIACPECAARVPVTRLGAAAVECAACGQHIERAADLALATLVRPWIAQALALTEGAKSDGATISRDLQYALTTEATSGVRGPSRGFS